MFLTRLGFGSKMVVTGDVTQVDLPGGTHQRPAGGPGHPRPASTTSTSRAHRRTTSCATASSAPSSTPTAAGTTTAGRGRPDRVSIDVLNETEYRLDELELVACARYVMEQMRVHPRPTCACASSTSPPWRPCTCSGWTCPGPPTSCASRWTSCGPGARATEPEEGVLGDIVLCPSVAAQAGRARPATPTEEELLLLTTHGILHLLGYDHAEPEEEKEMFELQRQLLLTFLATPRPPERLIGRHDDRTRHGGGCSAPSSPSCSPPPRPRCSRMSPHPGRRSCSTRAARAPRRWWHRRRHARPTCRCSPFLRVIAESTAAVMRHPRRRRPGRGHLAAVARRHRRSWR